MSKRKLIEVALPLDAINVACKADKDRKTGTIRNLHKWFAPMPLPAWRALLFAALVDDPESEAARDELMRVIERLVENGSDLPDPSTLADAKREISKSWPHGVPAVVDPFCGGGSTLVEAGRLGCETIAADLNPIPVMIARVLTELLPKVSGSAPLHEPEDRLPLRSRSYDGIAADVLHYGGVVRARALESLRAQYGAGGSAEPTVAWLWCRSVACPNPACGVQTPLSTSWQLSKQSGSQSWLEPAVDSGVVTLRVAGPTGTPPKPPKTGRGASFTCVACGAVIDEAYLSSEGHAGRLGIRMTAVVEDRDGRRSFREPTEGEEVLGREAAEADGTSLSMPANPRWFSPPLFGFATFDSLLLPRQLLCLQIFSDNVAAIKQDVLADGGTQDYAATVQALLGLCVGKLAQASSSLVRWNVRNGPPPKAEPAFGRHDVPMGWDFAEVNPFGGSVGDWSQIVVTALRSVSFAAEQGGIAIQSDARDLAAKLSEKVLVATDPPYYDQIGYADLSDYFYPWLRRSLAGTFPDLFATMATPKTGELVALPTRHGGSRERAGRYFVDGFTEAFESLATAQVDDAPMLVVYAFKEKGANGSGVSPGWAAILEAVVNANLMVTGTWPINGTGATRMVGLGTNALATYVVLVCRPRPTVAPRITRSDLTRLLRSELASAVAQLQHANIAPVDLAQAVIGPGMEVYSRHAGVVETDGVRVDVAAALALINRTLGEVLDEQEGDLDPDSRWAVTWYDEHGFAAASFGKADQLARAKGIAVDSLVQAGIVASGGNKVALITRESLSPRLGSSDRSPADGVGGCSAPCENAGRGW